MYPVEIICAQCGPMDMQLHLLAVAEAKFFNYRF